MRILFLSILAVSLSLPLNSFALTQAGAKNAEFTLNQASPGAMQKYKLGQLAVSGKKLVLKGTWDYDVVGGANNTSINLRDQYSTSLSLPAGAVITDVVIDSIVSASSASGGVFSLSTGSTAADLLASTAIRNFSTSARIEGIPRAGSEAATSIKLLADTVPYVKISSAAASGGRFNVFIEYFLSDTP